MPPMPPAGMAGASSSGSATMTSVVTMRLPMEAAFCKALRETIVGSVTPEVSSRVVDRLPYHAAAFSLPSTNSPFLNFAPALTNATR